MSGTSSSVPSSNTSALPAKNERGMNQAPLCVPATNSGVADRETGSSGIQNEMVWRAVDAVVRLVLMPRRADRRARLLDQHVVVEQAHLAGAHQLGGGAAHAARLDHGAVLGDVAPAAEVLDELAGAVGRRHLDGERAGLGDLALDALGQLLDQLRREEAGQEHGAVALERGDLLGSRNRGHHVFPGEPQMWSTFQPCQESTFTSAVTESRTRASNT